ncbi:MAG: carboxypeptidase regulatory-like domain-containing protein [Gemmatimonadetes bacterium]|nr:carboxypeptidase regulatory-like domain-containing protein [Gemmatimonadota bacterium]
MTRSTLGVALLLALSVSARAGHAQTIQGTVREEPSGQPIAGATVHLLDPTDDILGETFSDDDGQFAVRPPFPGTYRLAVSRIGYAQGRSDLFVVGPDDEPSMEIYLAVEPVPMESLEVVGESRVPHLELVGFYKRLEKGYGYFILREEIDRRSAVWVTDLFYGLPFARVVKINAVEYAVTMRGCSPTIVLDGMVIGDGGMNELVHPSNIEAIEVYPNPAGVPVQHGGLTGPCGAILIWTRR